MVNMDRLSLLDVNLINLGEEDIRVLSLTPKLFDYIDSCHVITWLIQNHLLEYIAEMYYISSDIHEKFPLFHSWTKGDNRCNLDGPSWISINSEGIIDRIDYRNHSTFGSFTISKNSNSRMDFIDFEIRYELTEDDDYRKAIFQEKLPLEKVNLHLPPIII